LISSRSRKRSIDAAITSTASGALLSNACWAPWISVSVVGTLTARSFVKKSMLDVTGTVLSSVP